MLLQELYSTVCSTHALTVSYRIENKDIFVDLRRNASGTYLKLSERKGTLRKTVLIPASGIARLQTVLDEVAAIADQPANK